MYITIRFSQFSKPAVVLFLFSSCGSLPMTIPILLRKRTCFFVKNVVNIREKHFESRCKFLGCDLLEWPACPHLLFLLSSGPFLSVAKIIQVCCFPSKLIKYYCQITEETWDSIIDTRGYWTWYFPKPWFYNALGLESKLIFPLRFQELMFQMHAKMNIVLCETNFGSTIIWKVGSELLNV